MDHENGSETLSRREFGGLSAAALATPLFGIGAGDAPANAATVASQPGRKSVRDSARSLNILFVFGDQERFFPKWPKDLSLPGHERLQRTGVTFENHYTSAIMCTPSRSVILTGLQTADNRMFDNADVPWIKSLSTNVPTIGHMLRKAGYYTAYKGKWQIGRAHV